MELWIIPAMTFAISTIEKLTMATKVRALYQRKKGRDLFDLWLALTELGPAGEEIIAAFRPYHPAGMTARSATDNLLRKVDDADFRDDLAPLVTTWPAGYDVESAAQLIIAEVLDRL